MKRQNKSVFLFVLVGDERGQCRVLFLQLSVEFVFLYFSFIFFFFAWGTFAPADELFLDSLAASLEGGLPWGLCVGPRTEILKETTIWKWLHGKTLHIAFSAEERMLTCQRNVKPVVGNLRFVVFFLWVVCMMTKTFDIQEIFKLKLFSFFFPQSPQGRFMHL